MVSKSFLDPERFIFTAGDVNTATSTFADDLLFSSAKRVVRFVGIIPFASASFGSTRLAVVFLIELVMNDASPGGLILDPGGVCAAPDPFVSSSEIALVRARFESSLASVPRRSRFVPRSFRLSDLNNFIALPINPADRRPVLVGDLPCQKSTRVIRSVTRVTDWVHRARARPHPELVPSLRVPNASRAANPTVVVHPPSLAPPSVHHSPHAPDIILSLIARPSLIPRSRRSTRSRAHSFPNVPTVSTKKSMNERVDGRAPLRAMRR